MCKVLPDYSLRTIIREMAWTDGAAVQRLLAEGPEAAQWLPGDLLQCGGKSMLLRVAEQNGLILGMIAFRITADEAEILNLAVAPASRRQRIGERLVKHALAHAKRQGAKQIFLEVRESNNAARTFYARMRFAQAARRRGYYRDPAEDALVLSRAVD
jgi:[ribosomal protein S18]-alanine N-acetyltransferase